MIQFYVLEAACISFGISAGLIITYEQGIFRKITIIAYIIFVILAHIIDSNMNVTYDECIKYPVQLLESENDDLLYHTDIPSNNLITSENVTVFYETFDGTIETETLYVEYLNTNDELFLYNHYITRTWWKIIDYDEIMYITTEGGERK